MGGSPGIILRAWLAFAAIAVGLIHLALVLSAPLWLAIPLAALGFAEFSWGVLAFARERPPTPTLAIVVALLPIVIWVAALALSGTAAGLARPDMLLPMGVASLFELFVAAALGRLLRGRGTAPETGPGTTRYLLGLGAGALITAALVTPALAAAQAPAYEGAGLELPTHHGP